MHLMSVMLDLPGDIMDLTTLTNCLLDKAIEMSNAEGGLNLITPHLDVSSHSYLPRSLRSHCCLITLVPTLPPFVKRFRVEGACLHIESSALACVIALAACAFDATRTCGVQAVFCCRPAMPSFSRRKSPLLAPSAPQVFSLACCLGRWRSGFRE